MEPEQVYREQVQKDASEAAMILNHPLLARFFDKQRKTIFNAFRNLPLEADVKQYMALHCLLEQTEALESDLKTYVERAQDYLVRETINKEE